jgi:hypothetical protein
MKEYPKDFYWFEGKRILLRRLVNRQQRLMATIADATFITNKNLYSILPIGDRDLYSILGVLNSKLMSYLYTNQITQATKDDFPAVTIMDILSLPFPMISQANSERLGSLVRLILDLNQKLSSAKTPDEKTRLEREIKATDNQIDQLVYELYGLTKEEIEIVEQKS